MNDNDANDDWLDQVILGLVLLLLFIFFPIYLASAVSAWGNK